MTKACTIKPFTTTKILTILAHFKNIDYICGCSLAEVRFPVVAGAWLGTQDIKKGVFLSLIEMRIGIIISTYNNPAWLEKTLWGYLCQTRMADEIIIADDGSKLETRETVMKYSNDLPIKYVWHEDKGFRKTKILNEALKVAESDYLIFTDQDCIPRQDFVAIHEHYARHGHFLSGGYFKLPMSISQEIRQRNIISQEAFRLKRLRQHGLRYTFKCTKLIQAEWFSKMMNHITPVHATWNGMNSSGWRSDIMAAKGFDERMQYGGEDRELGERLVNAGICGIQIRYQAIVLHLDHQRPYKNIEAIEKNLAIRQQTKKSHLTKTEYGL